MLEVQKGLSLWRVMSNHPNPLPRTLVGNHKEGIG